MIVFKRIGQLLLKKKKKHVFFQDVEGQKHTYLKPGVNGA